MDGDSVDRELGRLDADMATLKRSVERLDADMASGFARLEMLLAVRVDAAERQHTALWNKVRALEAWRSWLLGAGAALAALWAAGGKVLAGLFTGKGEHAP